MTTTYAPAGALLVAQRRLQTLAEGLGDTDLTDEIELAARFLTTQFPTLPDYEQLDENHRSFFDLVVGLRAAINLLAPAILAANDGMAKLKTPEFEYTFAVPSLGERERWAAEIAEATGYLERIARPPKPERPAFSMFGAAGVARARQQCYKSHAELVRLFVPDGWLYNSWFGAEVW